MWSSGAGSSVGSLYHHFGGKSELFLALYQEHQLAHEEAAREAVAAASEPGDRRDRAVLRGRPGLLDGTWQRRDLAMLFFAGDRPARLRGHQAAPRREWIGRTTPCSGCPTPRWTACTRPF